MNAKAKRSHRTALVLGAGGPVGHAYHAGVLRALHEHRGWDARDATLIVGTSAGAGVAALLRAGLSPRDMFARAVGAPLSPEGDAIARHVTRPTLRVRLPSRVAPASLAMLWRSLRGHSRPPLGALVAAALPQGDADLAVVAAGLRAVFGGRWPDGLLIPAVDLDRGETVVFGRVGAPAADVGAAVTSSSAVPAVCAPVVLGERRFVDGGVASTHHADAVDEDFDHIVVSSPLSAVPWIKREIAREAERRRGKGTTFDAFEPSGSVRRAIGFRFLDVRRAPRVAQLAYEATVLALQAEGPAT